jgi:transposase-like protein
VVVATTDQAEVAALPNAFPPLDEATERALGKSIRCFGVILPIVRDQHGRILDGYHRARIAKQLGIDPPEIVMPVENDDDARAISETLNNDRRHLDPEQRREVVSALRADGHSLRAIAGAVKVSKDTVAKDVRQLSTGRQLAPPERVLGLDGKSRPASRQSEPHEVEPASGDTAGSNESEATTVRLSGVLADILAVAGVVEHASAEASLKHSRRYQKKPTTTEEKDEWVKQWKSALTTLGRFGRDIDATA